MDVLLEIPLEGGKKMVVEVDEEQAGPVPAGRAGEVVATATQNFESALSGALAGAEELLDQLRSIRAPEEVVLEFGLKVTGEAGIVFSKFGGEANFNVSLTWKREQASP